METDFNTDKHGFWASHRFGIAPNFGPLPVFDDVSFSSFPAQSAWVWSTHGRLAALCLEHAPL